MGKLIEIAPMAAKEDKLEQISEYLGELKDEFAVIIEEYEAEGEDFRSVNGLAEALDALEDAHEIIEEVVDGRD